MIFFLLLLLPVHAATWSDLGCFAESDISSFLSNQGSYTYQTTSYCENLCADYAVAALLNGKYCYCGLEIPALSLLTDSSNCNVACQGYGTVTCGGDGYFEVYVNSDVSASTQVVSLSTLLLSLSSSSLSSSKTSLKTTSSSSSTEPASLSMSLLSSSLTAALSLEATSSSAQASSSASITTLVSTVTNSPSGSSNSVVEVTTTVGLSSSATTTDDSSKNSSGSGSKSKSLSGGAIAGIVIGALAGVALLAGLVFLFIWRKRRNDAEDEDFFDLGGGRSEKPYDSIAPNPFLGAAAGATAGGMAAGHTHNNSNTTRSYSTNNDDHDHDVEYANDDDIGRRRLSNGSLPDMMTRNPGSLKVVNN